MRPTALIVLWLLAAIGFLGCIGLAYVTWYWATEGSGGYVPGASISPFSWVLLASPLVSAVVAALALKARSRSIWPPILIAAASPLLLLISNLMGPHA